MSRSKQILTGEVLDERVSYSLRDLCRVCDVHAEIIIEIVDEGIVTPAGREPRMWRFDGRSVIRVQRALRLQHDLGVNLAGAALAVDLLEEIDELRRRLRFR
ncbi:MAG: chaperone modulator CbpM [Gammaproteobacteria bacterium]|nr:chaperone modulator CbpM [Gammaproteobacteria bacterium]